MTDDVKALIAEFDENIPRDLSDWANIARRLRDALEDATVTPAVDREALANGLRRRFGVSNGTQTWVEFQGTADGLSQVVVDMLGARDVRQVQAEALEQAADDLTPGDDKVDDWGIRAGLLRARAQAIREARND